MGTRVNPRLGTLLASLALNLGEEGQRAMEEASGLVGTAPVALLALAEFLEGAYVGRLADVLGLTHSGAVRLVSLLEREGLVERRSGSDRRRVEVTLTSAGRERAVAARRARDVVVEQAIGELDPGAAAALEDLLERVIATRGRARIEARRAGGTGPWWCRTCDFTACGRPEGRCPAQTAANSG